MVPFWFVLIAFYVFWNLLNYVGDKILIEIEKQFNCTINIPFAQDLIYWFGERIFILLAFVYLYQQVKDSIWLRFAWLPKTFIWIAAGKLIYLIPVVAQWIKPNQHWEWMAIAFVLVMGFLLRKMKIQRKLLKLGVPKWNT